MHISLVLAGVLSAPAGGGLPGYPGVRSMAFDLGDAWRGEEFRRGRPPKRVPIDVGFCIAEVHGLGMLVDYGWLDGRIDSGEAVLGGVVLNSDNETPEARALIARAGLGLVVRRAAP
jgi:hypothetical protein